MNTAGTAALTASIVSRPATGSPADGSLIGSGAGGTQPTSPSVAVTLSSLATRKAETAGARDSDIRDSDLPDAVKETLARLREIRKQITEKTAELQAALSDTSLDPQAQQARVAALQTALSALNTALMSANAALQKAYKHMTAEQVKAAMLLALKG